MQIKAYAISDVEGMKRIEHIWDAFIIEHGGCPFLLSGFVSQFLRPNPYDFKACILVFSIDNKIIGVVPLEIKDDLFFRKCRFLMNTWLFPSDFVFDPRYTRDLLRETLAILFRNMGCLFFDFRVPAESPCFSLLEQVCGELGISYLSSPSMGRAIVPVNGSWIQFEKSRRHLKREFERTERRMREMGQLNIEWFGNGDDRAEILNRILTVEKASWKYLNQPPEKFRVDPSILYVLNGCAQISLTVPEFNWGVAVLDLDGTPIAHSMFLEYNGHAYDVKTSFDNRYRKQGPGIYITHAVVRELMSKSEVKVIDFMSDLPFSHKWASEVVPVNWFILSRNDLRLLYLEGLLHTIIHNPRRLTHLSSILKSQISPGKR